ncbi:hypothetical protein GIB67_009253 [Kingdonia uniflora]|uniref:Large ribosomal subunit protein mL54 n=1 Tax=Kingdonia uniflora TaxID=39325 RepID=A0A7J7N2U1_9MAGN|nr:hypothetical protein GIB67_009253 [Kingdonia uniflora]
MTSFSFSPEMAMSCTRLMRSTIAVKETIGVVGRRTFSAKKKGGKGSAASDAPKASILSNEVKSTTVVCGNILKDGTDPKITADSDYPDWLWNLLDKKPALSELRRKDVKTLGFGELKRYVKLDNRARIKENNSIKSKK